MTVILNDAAITRLFEAPNGPVARFVEDIAVDVVAAVQQDVRFYFATAPTLDVDQDVSFIQQGSTAIIGVKNTDAAHSRESKSRRLQRLGLWEKWFKDRLQENI